MTKTMQKVNTLILITLVYMLTNCKPVKNEESDEAGSDMSYSEKAFNYNGWKCSIDDQEDLSDKSINRTINCDVNADLSCTITHYDDSKVRLFMSKQKIFNSNGFEVTEQKTSEHFELSNNMNHDSFKKQQNRFLDECKKRINSKMTTNKSFKKRLKLGNFDCEFEAFRRDNDAKHDEVTCYNRKMNVQCRYKWDRRENRIQPYRGNYTGSVQQNRGDEKSYPAPANLNPNDVSLPVAAHLQLAKAWIEKNCGQP